MIIDEKPKSRALPSTPQASAMSEKARLAAANAASSLSPTSTNYSTPTTVLSPKRQAMLANAGYSEYSPLSAAAISSVPSSAPSRSVRSASISTAPSQTNTQSPITAVPTPYRTSASQSQSSIPLHSVSRPSLGAITPNPLLFRHDVAIPPAPSQSSQIGAITPFPLNNPYARSQPPGMLGNAYPTTPAPVIERPSGSSSSHIYHIQLI